MSADECIELKNIKYKTMLKKIHHKIVPKEVINALICLYKKGELEKISGPIFSPLPNINAAALFGRPAFNKSLKKKKQ